MTCSNCDWEYVAPDDSTGSYELDDTSPPDDTLDEIMWELHREGQVALAGDAASVEPPYPFCTGYPTKRDCAVRGYCAKEIACDN